MMRRLALPVAAAVTATTALLAPTPATAAPCAAPRIQIPTNSTGTIHLRGGGTTRTYHPGTSTYGLPFDQVYVRTGRDVWMAEITSTTFWDTTFRSTGWRWTYTSACGKTYTFREQR